MTTETRGLSALELQAQIEDILVLLKSAEHAVQSRDFGATALVLKVATDKVAALQMAAPDEEEPVELEETETASWKKFERPILELLVQEGGTARNWQVFQYMEEHVELDEKDIQPHVQEARETEWEHGCRIAAREMREPTLGYLEPMKVQGLWTITPAGRERLRELQASN